MAKRKKKTAERALLFAGDLALLFAGDLASDGEVEAATIEAAVDLALDAGVSALPDVVMVEGIPIPVGKVVDAFLRPLIERGILALVDLARPKRADVHAASGEVVMRVHDD